MIQTTGLQRSETDQYYTRPEIAALCVSHLTKHVSTGIWIEPAAGAGVFLDLVAGSRGYDIDPKRQDITRADFLEVDLPESCVVFGNPPFGRQSSLAKKFLRHAAEKADWIGFILPRSFTIPSMQSAIPLQFHLVESIDLPENSFVVNDAPHNVPCVFQIWNRKDHPRLTEPPETPAGFRFVKKSEGYDLAFRRVGVYAGRCCLPSAELSEQSHYFLAIESSCNLDTVVSLSRSHVFPTNTTGPRSLSKNEAIRFLNSAIADSAA